MAFVNELSLIVSLQLDLFSGKETVPEGTAAKASEGKGHREGRVNEQETWLLDGVH